MIFQKGIKPITPILNHEIKSLRIYVGRRSPHHLELTDRNKCTKISGLESNIFGLKMIYFEILIAPSEIPANLPGQFSPSGQIFLHWAAATLKGLVRFQNKNF